MLSTLKKRFNSGDSERASLATSMPNYGSISIDVAEDSKAANSERVILGRLAQESSRRDAILRQNQACKRPLSLLAILGILGGCAGLIRAMWNYSKYLDNRLQEIRSPYCDYPCPTDYDTFSMFDEVCETDPDGLESCDTFFPDQYCAAPINTRLEFHLLSNDCLPLLMQMCKELGQFQSSESRVQDAAMFEFFGSITIIALCAFLLSDLHNHVINKTNEVEREAVLQLMAAGILPFQNVDGESGQIIRHTIHRHVTEQLTVLEREDEFNQLRTVLLTNLADFPADLVKLICFYLKGYSLQQEINAALSLLRCKEFQISLAYAELKKNNAQSIMERQHKSAVTWVVPEFDTSIISKRYQFLQDPQSCVFPAKVITLIQEYINLKECGVVLMPFPVTTAKKLSSIEVESLDEVKADGRLQVEQLEEINQTIKNSEIDHNAVYVRMNCGPNQYLFYFNRNKDEFISMNINIKRISHFDRLVQPTCEVRTLTYDELEAMKRNLNIEHDHCSGYISSAPKV